jgi:hypothetical protein
MDYLRQKIEIYDFYKFGSVKTYSDTILLEKDTSVQVKLSTLDHLAEMEKSGDNDALKYYHITASLMMLAYEVKDMSAEFSQHLLHLAHLKYPNVVGGNSDLQINLTELAVDMSMQTMADAVDV